MTPPLLVYDGDCGFCTTAAHWGQRRLGLAAVEPWQWLDLDALGLSEADCRRAVQWVAADGSRATGAAAVAAACRSAGGAWRAVGIAIGAPGVRSLAAGAYRLVAHFRYRLPGGTPACRVPPG